ncbi:hypothetical protein GGF31_000888 [Allomyces arbusculus]|nr:hypothetical protein GGF31_000888 [Allomyces arbusculus]
MTRPWTVLAALFLAFVALATHCAAALRTVHVHVHGPLLAEAAASATSATDDASAVSTAAPVLAPVVSGGLLRVNMTAIAPVPRNGVITLTLPAGRHRLSLTHPDYAFDDLLVTLTSADAPPRFAVVALDRPNTAAGKAITTDPVAWSARAHRAYLEHKAGFDPLAMVKSPMMLMSLFSLGMMFVLPKMMEAVEEEAGGRTDDPATTGPNLVHQFKELK